MTSRQMKVFWSAFAKACKELCIAKADQEAYRREIMWDAAKAVHLKEVSSTTGYEALMTRLASDTGDWQMASQFAVGDERRIGAMIDDCTRQVFEIINGFKSDDVGLRISYVSAILEQAGLSRVRINSPAWWMDWDANSPVKVFQIIDTYRRRLLRRKAHDGRLGYKFGTIWVQ